MKLCIVGAVLLHEYAISVVDLFSFENVQSVKLYNTMSR